MTRSTIFFVNSIKKEKEGEYNDEENEEDEGCPLKTCAIDVDVIHQRVMKLILYTFIVCVYCSGNFIKDALFIADNVSYGFFN